MSAPADASGRIALLLFSKPPLPGLVKTRLSVLKDGVFSPEDAAYLFHCMLFDVVETCCKGLDGLEACGDLPPVDILISTTPRENLPVMRGFFEDAGTWPRPLEFLYDEGASFDEHYNHAFSQVWERGYDAVLSMGADMPALTTDDIERGIRALARLLEAGKPGMVLAPDQELGVSIVGWTRQTPMTHDGVFYNKDGITVLPAYIAKAREAGLPAIYLPPVPDVDTMMDLYHNVTLVEALMYTSDFEYAARPYRTAAALDYVGLSEVRIPPNDLHDDRDTIDK